MEKTNIAQTSQVTTPVKYDVTKLKGLSTTSARIRYLHGCGLSRGEIVKVFEKVLERTIRYQHVRNVLITPVTKAKESVE